VDVDEERGEKLLKMIDALEDSDDVQAVYANFEMSEKVLEKLPRNVVDTKIATKLKLPIIIMTDTAYDGGAWKIMGKVEVKVVSRIVEREPEYEDSLRLFHPHMAKLRTVLPTATTTMFSP
jgi:uncharacterized protein (UPF0216 family)